MRPTVICHMIASLDDKLHPSRWTASPDGDRRVWGAAYEAIHNDFAADAWLVGRVTMAEISKAAAHPPASFPPVARPVHVADGEARRFAVAVDPSGKVHFAGGDLDGDHVVVVLGRDVADAHLAELAADRVSYIVADGEGVDLAAALDTLGRTFGIRRLLLEGGAAVNGAFFAAGLVDEFSLLVAPALDGRTGEQAIVESGPASLAGKVRLSFVSAQTLDHGLVHLRYRALPD